MARRAAAQAAIEAFPPERLRAWSEALGQPTFVGSSGRVFPQGVQGLALAAGVAAAARCAGRAIRAAPPLDRLGRGRPSAVSRRRTDRAPSRPRATVLALGGASWPRLGSDGAWAEILAAKDVAISPLRPANCGFTVAWSEIFRDRFEGQPLKGVALSFGAHTVRGEAMITRSGIEGGAVYALSADLREAILGSGRATLHIALRPDLASSDLIARLSAPRGKQSFSNSLRKAVQLSPVCDRTVAGGGETSGLSLSSLSAGRPGRADQCGAGRTQRYWRRSRARSRAPAALRWTSSMPIS